MSPAIYTKILTPSNNYFKNSILLYNSISGHGHLDSWVLMLSSILLKRGYQVLILTPNYKNILNRIDKQDFIKQPYIYILNWNIKTKLSDYKGNLSLLILSKLIKTKNCYSQYIKKVSSLSKSPIWSWFCIPYYRGIVLIIDYLQKHCFFEIGCVDLHDLEKVSPIDMILRIKLSTNEYNISPELVLIMYMDCFMTGDRVWSYFDQYCVIPCAGITFAPTKSLTEGYYKSSRFYGMCLLSENDVKYYRDNIHDKIFSLIPDITNVQINLNKHPIVDELLKRSAGRKIILLGGGIGKQKNIMAWYKLITLSDPRKWFFAQIGEIFLDTMDSDEKKIVKLIRDESPANVLVYDKFIEDEGDFNAIINTIDYIFAVYLDFRNSSNMLAKAAYFQKPILVSERYLMGERVHRYGIGRTVPENDIKAMLEAFENFTSNPVPTENFALYCADFNEEKMGDVLEDFITRCMEKRK